jgi:ribosome biogenesis GTPase
MAKRKLNKRQKWRIDKIQQERTERAQRKESQISHQLEGGDLGPEQQGIIIAHFGTQVEVEPLDATPGDTESLDSQQRETFRCYMRANLGSLVTGDKIIFRMGNNNEGVVVAVLPRESELSRPNPYNEIKPVAANIDFIVLVVAVEPEAHANLIDRYLVAAENCQIEPVILLNKTDLITDKNREELEALLAPYDTLGYQTRTLSIKNDEGLEELKEMLNDRISVFVGQSGVGKSSMIQTLLPEEEIRVGALSHASKKGRHTTTTARLYHFPSGGDLIDSPGIREFGLWHMEPEDILYGFRELREFAGLCRFRDCQHEKEPGCALRDGVEEGKISAARFASYKRILATLSEFS